MSHDYAKQKPCGRHTHKRTLRLPSIAKLTFDTKNRETGQRNEEEKLSQYDSKNGGNATIWRQRWRQELLEFDQSSITPIARRSRGTPKKPNARTGPSQGLRKSVTLETAAKKLKRTYDFQWNRTAKTEGANLNGTNSTQEEQSPNKLRMSLFDMFLKR